MSPALEHASLRRLPSRVEGVGRFAAPPRPALPPMRTSIYHSFSSRRKRWSNLPRCFTPFVRHGNKCAQKSAGYQRRAGAARSSRPSGARRPGPARQNEEQEMSNAFRGSYTSRITPNYGSPRRRAPSMLSAQEALPRLSRVCRGRAGRHRARHDRGVPHRVGPRRRRALVATTVDHVAMSRMARAGGGNIAMNALYAERGALR